MNRDFIKGVDISSLPQMLDEGKQFYNYNGESVEVLSFLKENGVNYIRLRIWNEPGNIPESGGYCDLSQTVDFAKKIKGTGLPYLLDFHYSDWWADPAKQTKPKAWENLSTDELIRAVYDYSKTVLETLKSYNVYPDMVQVGNEIRSGMLFPEGSVSNWPTLAKLINSAIKAVRDTSSDLNRTPVMIHLDQGGRYYYFEEWFDAAIANGVSDFEYIGLSYYPFWHGGFQDLKYTLDFLADKYKRPLIVAETAHAWQCGTGGMFTKEQERISGFPASPAGQKQVLELVMSIMANTKNNLGHGIFYWEPMMLPLNNEDGWAQDMGLFGHNGHPSDGFLAYKFDPYRYQNEIVKIFLENLGYVLLGSPIKYPKTVTVLQWDGHVKDVVVTWLLEDINLSLPGERVINGEVSDSDLLAELRFEVCESLPEYANLLLESDFTEHGFQWDVICSTENVNIEWKTELIKPFPEPPEPCLCINAKENFLFQLSKQTDHLPIGTYTFSLDVAGDNTTGVDITLFLEWDSKKISIPIFLAGDGYQTFKLDDLVLPGVSVRVGIQIDSPPIKFKIKQPTLLRKQ